MKAIEALKAAIEGECDGLAIDDRQARNILAFITDESLPQDEQIGELIERISMVAYLAAAFEVSGTIHASGTAPSEILGAAMTKLVELAAANALHRRHRDHLLAANNRYLQEMRDHKAFAAKATKALDAMVFAFEKLSVERPAHDSAATRDILAERARQINSEGFGDQYDDQNRDGSLATAAACYALHEPEMVPESYALGARLLPRLWPKSWGACWWKPTSRRRNLVKAGALIIAEIERLDRAAQGGKVDG